MKKNMIFKMRNKYETFENKKNQLQYLETRLSKV